MHRCTLIVLAACLLTGMPARAQSAGSAVDEPVTSARVPNFLGSVGLLAAPTAYVPRDGTISGYFSGTSRFITAGVLGGIGGRLELGASIFDRDNGAADFLGNAKLALLEERDNRPAVAIGVIDVAENIANDPSWFVVASKYFTRAETEQRFSLKGHFGVGGGVYDETILAGAELFFGRNLGLLAELVDGDVNFGVRYGKHGFAATIGLFDFDRFGGQIAYTLRFR